MLVILMSDRKVCITTFCVCVTSPVESTTLHSECILCQQMCIFDRCHILFDELQNIQKRGALAASSVNELPRCKLMTVVNLSGHGSMGWPRSRLGWYEMVRERGPVDTRALNGLHVF